MADLILIADDDPDIIRFVELNLRLEGYDVLTAGDGEQALRLVHERVPALAILDVMMPKLDGYEVCQNIRSDGRTSHISVIMLTAKAMSADKVLGLTAGADDYISKPFDPMELVARVKTTLRRATEMRAASPLTGLAGNVQVEAELQRRVSRGDAFALLWLDIDNFKSYNDRYGFSEGDKAILYLADVLRKQTYGKPGAFLGHIGGDDFVVICAAPDAEAICEAVVKRFDEGVADLYDPADVQRGFVKVRDRRGNDVEAPLISVSIGGATNENSRVTDHREIVEIATEMKSYVKTKPGSVYAIDRRQGSD